MNMYKNNVIIRFCRAFNYAFLPKKVKVIAVLFALVTGAIYFFNDFNLVVCMFFACIPSLLVSGFMLEGEFRDFDYDEIMSAHWLNTHNWVIPWKNKD